MFIEDTENVGSLLLIGHEFWRSQLKVREGQVGSMMEQVKRDTKQFGNKH